MEVKVDCSYIREQRERRAWSQEHLAEVTGLGLRTIQRIEKTGAASYESARSLAAVFGIDVAELRVAVQTPAPPPRRSWVAMRSLLGGLAALVTGSALFFASSSFADQVLMDVGMTLNTPLPGSTAIQTRAWKTQVLVDEGTLVTNVNDLRLEQLRFSIVPDVRGDGRIMLALRIFERRGDAEVLLSEPRLLSADGEEAGIEVSLAEGRSLRLAITARRR
jgi:transcriptional regulator with XRE-family HTH domain